MIWFLLSLVTTLAYVNLAYGLYYPDKVPSTWIATFKRAKSYNPEMPAVMVVMTLCSFVLTVYLGFNPQ